MRIRTATAGLATGLLLVLATMLGPATLGAGPAAAAEDPRTQFSPGAAKETLVDARAALSGTAGPSHDLTLDLRDLAVARDDLAGADRSAADAMLNRPTDPDELDAYRSARVKSACGPLVCLHWTEAAGNPNAASPAYAAKTLATVNHIAQTYLDAGYRAPKPDGRLGGNAKPDVYLTELSDYAYGYCTTDEPIVGGQHDYWAYCVLDNDYAEYGDANTPLDLMRVTAAHEFFHAVQFAYDAFEDRWLMEGSATWVEDEVYDDVNDSRNYLSLGQLGAASDKSAGYGPRVPLDEHNQSGGSMYGNWVFFRHLTERLPAEEGGIPVLMRTIWENADSTNGAANDQHSPQAVASALAAAGIPFRSAYTSFAVANRQPAAFYEEARDLGYSTPGLARKPVTLTPTKPRTTWGSLKQDHLTNDTVRFTPGKKMTRPWKLEVHVNMAPEARGSVAYVTVFFKDREAGLKQIKLNGTGDGSTKVPFARAAVRHVELTMINASDRTNCWAAGNDDPAYYSCRGIPLDDKMNVAFRAVASR